MVKQNIHSANFPSAVVSGQPLKTAKGYTLKTAKGFTLLEVMIAIAVFAVMSAMAYSGLNSVMRSKQGMDEHADRLVKIQKAFTIIGRDIEQTVARAIRDEYGDEKEMLRSQEYEDIKLELTHTGWRNPFPNEKRVRSVLQRTAYQLKDNQLQRLYWFDLDRGTESKPFETPLLDNVQVFELRFVDQNKQWQTQWPKLNSDEIIPLAVEVNIEIDGLGRLTRLFRVPARATPVAASAPPP